MPHVDRCYPFCLLGRHLISFENLSKIFISLFGSLISSS